MFRIIPRRALIEPKATVEHVEAGEICSTATMHIDGLVCSVCASNVRRGFEQLDGVRSADVDLESGEARIEYDPSRVAPEDLVAAVERKVLLPKARRLLATIAGRASVRRRRQAEACPSGSSVA